MFRIKVVVVLMGAIFIISFFTACGFYASSSPFLAGAEQKKPKFGATYMTMSNPFFVEVNEGIKKVVEANGGTLVTLDPQLDVHKQIAQVEDFIDQKVDLIFLSPADWKGIKPALDAAKRAGIPIIVVDAPVYDDDLVESTVSSDNWKAGTLCAEHMIRTMGEQGNIVILEHSTVKTSIDRTKSFEEVISRYPNIKVVAKHTSDGQLEKAMLVMENILQANEKIDAVMCLNDPTALGAIAAMQNAQRLKGVLVYGVDGSVDGKKMIKAGNLTATVAQFPKEIGRIAAETAYKKLAGEKIEHNLKVDVILVDKYNVDKY